MAERRQQLSAQQIGVNNPREFVLDDPGNDGQPWFFADPEATYQDRPSPYWLMNVVVEPDGEQRCLKLTEKMHAEVDALHRTYGLGRGARFSLQLVQEGRQRRWEAKLLARGDGTSASVPQQRAASAAAPRSTRSATAGAPTVEPGPMRNRNDVTLWSLPQARAMWTEACARAEESFPEPHQGEKEPPTEVRAARCSARQSAIATFVIFAREAVPPSEFGGAPVAAAGGVEVDALRKQLAEMAMERNLDMRFVAAALSDMFLTSQVQYADLLRQVIDDFPAFAEIVILEMREGRRIPPGVGGDPDPNVDRESDADPNVDAEPVDDETQETQDDAGDDAGATEAAAAAGEEEGIDG